jgi:RHS repeat-associated protein
VTSVLSHNSGQTSVVQQLAYTAFGAIGSIKDGQGSNVTTGPISRFAYTGREFDPETGDYYYRARYYDPQTGRFLSQDPIGFAAGDMNLYRYVGNSSPNFVDPSGLQAGRRIGQDPRPEAPVGPVRYNDGSPGPRGSLPGFAPQGDDLSHLYVRTDAIIPIGVDPVVPPTSVPMPTGGYYPLPPGPGEPAEPYPLPFPGIGFPGMPGVKSPNDVCLHYKTAFIEGAIVAGIIGFRVNFPPLEELTVEQLRRLIARLPWSRLWGSGERGAAETLQRLKQGERIVIDGIKRCHLKVYREIARRAIEDSNKNTPVQHIRKEIVEIMLRRRLYLE